MTYVQQAVAAMSEIPDYIAAFAEAQGWTRALLTITRPGGGKAFSLSYGNAPSHGRQAVIVSTMDGSNLLTRLTSPLRGGTQGNPTILAPTKLHMFSSEAPYTDANPPWLAIAVEFGFNVYRHLYIGNMVKIGNYGGGEVICANSHSEWHDNFAPVDPLFSNLNFKYMFSANHNHQTEVGLAAGGVNIEHADNAVPWRRFDGPTPAGFMQRFWAGNEVFGGWSDNINGALAQSGLSSYASSNILVPINLYVPRSGSMDVNYRYRPIGQVPGVRLVRMDGYEPAQQVEIGGSNWMVFPEFSRNILDRAKRNSGAGWYWEYESSYLAGLAYAMD